jgi:sigma-B regulation protein RsbU (phosphoserine phosphatase)
MMKSRAIIQSSAIPGMRAKDILTKANKEICANNHMDMFVTVWLGILDTRTGEVVAANAGHEYPFITDESGKFQAYHDPHGLMCGAMEGVEYTDYTFTIPKGGKLFVYTDGVTEAQNVAEELFGMERLGESLNKYADKSPKEVIDGMHTQIAAFEGESEQFDDITMLCINYR